jgi:putative ABC transport system permease protein
VLRGVVVFQASLTLALLVGAGLLIQTAMNLARVQPGYDTRNVLTLSVTDMNLLNYFSFHGQALERVSALPGVEHAAFAWGVPLTGNRWTTTILEIEGRAGSGRLKDALTIPSRSVTPGYFELMGQRILAGRGFPQSYSTDTNRMVMPRIAIVNQTLADRFFHGAPPIGKKFRAAGGPNGSTEIEIIGVVSDARTESLTLRPVAEIYFSFWEALSFTKHLIVRTASDPMTFAGVIQRELRGIEPTVAIENVKTMVEIRNDSIAPSIFAMRLLAAFSATACVLAFVGIFGVLSLSVNARRRELAIRTALGSPRGHILGLVFGEAFRLVAMGVALGLGIAACLVHPLRALLYGVAPIDLPTLIAAPMALLVIAVLAAWIPARSASAADPMEALRHE